MTECDRGLSEIGVTQADQAANWIYRKFGLFGCSVVHRDFKEMCGKFEVVPYYTIIPRSGGD